MDIVEKLGAQTWDLPEQHPPGDNEPWTHEPDKLQWLDPASDLDCLAVRNHTGTWCGYVGVPPGHPCWGADYDDVPALVHGGLTYANLCDEHGLICHVPLNGRPEEVWWLGFDCGHGEDMIPRFVMEYPDREIWRRGVTYRDLAYVTDQVTQLAGQLGSIDLDELRDRKAANARYRDDALEVPVEIEVGTE